jgi:S1-C subfamily serine protease
VILSLLVAALASSPRQTGAQSATPNAATDQATVAALEHTLVDVIHNAEPSVVAIGRTPPVPQQGLLNPPPGDLLAAIRQPQPPAAELNIVAAGVIIDPAGLVLTEYLAVREGEQHTVTTVDGKTYPATIKAADPRSGLAVLAVSMQAGVAPRAANQSDLAATGQLKPIPFGDAAQLRKGQFVIAIGNPYAIRSDGEPTASWGIVSNLARKAPAGTNLNDTPGPNNDYRTTVHHLGTLIQTDAKLGWSAGGGALVDLQGRLVGLTTTIATIAGHEQPAGYAIPIDEPTRRIIDTLKQGREVEYGLLGIGFQPPNPAAPSISRGAIVQQVYPGGPAARVKLQTGDIITRVADHEIADPDELQLAVSRSAPSQQVRIDYLRNGHEASSEVTLSKLPIPGKKIVTDEPPRWRGVRVDYAMAVDAMILALDAGSTAIDPEGCVVVSDVTTGSPAWNAGIRSGMFISHVNDRRVSAPNEFRTAVQNATGNVEVRLTQPLRPTEGAGSADVQIAPEH